MTAPEDTPPDSGAFRVAFVAGVTPDKWVKGWRTRRPDSPLELLPVDDGDQTNVLHDDRVHMAFVRLPVTDESLHIIPLYTETPVVVAAKGHFIEAADEVTVADLTGELVHRVPPLTVREAVETAAAGVGVVVVPMSLARLHHRRDVVHRPVVDGPTSQVGLAWRRDLDDERVEVFIGVVRGRTANSSRGAASPTSPNPAPSASRDRPAKKSTAPRRTPRRPRRRR